MRPKRVLENRSHEMARYLISFDEGAMTFPEEELTDVAEAAHAVVQQAMDAGVWVFGGGLYSPRGAERGGHRWDGHRRPVPGEQGVHRRILGRRRALTRGGAGVGCQNRRRLPLCPRCPRVPARLGGGQLMDTRRTSPFPPIPNGQSPAPVCGNVARDPRASFRKRRTAVGGRPRPRRPTGRRREGRSSAIARAGGTCCVR